MDTMGWAASTFGGLPYFNPMMMVNTSGTCATTRLIQCRGLGISMNDISRKFQQAPEDVPDLSKDDFLARKAVVRQVSDWCSKNRNSENEWTPILYHYEIVKGSAKRERDWGHLIFTDMTTTRFLLVMVFPLTCNCGNLSHHDFDALTKYQADRFMSLLKYLHHDEGRPQWVRATYTTPLHKFKLDPIFLSNTQTSTNGTKFPPVIHVTPDVFVPSLLPSDLEKIDNLRAHGHSTEAVPNSVRDEVIGSKETRPDVSAAWKQSSPRQCAHCETVREKNLSRCSRCKLVQYCGPECQRLAWPLHKLVCKKA